MKEKPSNQDSDAPQHSNQALEQLLKSFRKNGWTEKAISHYAIGFTTIEAVLCQLFKDRWNTITLGDVFNSLRKNPQDEKEYPFEPLRDCLTKDGIDKRTATLAIKTGVKTLLRAKRIVPQKPVSIGNMCFELRQNAKNGNYLLAPMDSRPRIEFAKENPYNSTSHQLSQSQEF